MHSVEPSSVTRRVWPNGWSWNPIRFVFSTANLKSLAHAFVLAVLCGPMALLSLLGLVLIGGVGSASDDMWRGMAFWRGCRVPRPRTPGVDWRTWLCALVQMLLGAAAFGVLSMGSVLAGAFAWAAITTQHGWDLFGWYPGDGLARPVMASLSLITLMLEIVSCWVLSGLSVAVWALLTMTRTTVDDLQRSRKVLTDSFSSERRRIERELHDGVQQYLTATQLALATAQLASTDNPEALAAIAIAQENTGRAVAALRTTIRGIHPRVLDEAGLTEAVRELVGLSGLRGSVQVQENGHDQQVSSSGAVLLYHAVAEAMTNAVRHGGASAVAVTVTWHAESVEVTAVDDGTGPQDGAVSPDSSGLAGLTQQAEMLGGSLWFGQDKATGGGRLRVQIPRKTAV